MADVCVFLLWRLCSQWFITIFTYNFPFAAVVRIWDAFLLEGWKVVFRVALSLLKLHERKPGWLLHSYPTPP